MQSQGGFAHSGPCADDVQAAVDVPAAQHPVQPRKARGDARRFSFRLPFHTVTEAAQCVRQVDTLSSGAALLRHALNGLLCPIQGLRGGQFGVQQFSPQRRELPAQGCFPNSGDVSGEVSGGRRCLQGPDQQLVRDIQTGRSRLRPDGEGVEGPRLAVLPPHDPEDHPQGF